MEGRSRSIKLTSKINRENRGRGWETRKGYITCTEAWEKSRLQLGVEMETRAKRDVAPLETIQELAHGKGESPIVQEVKRELRRKERYKVTRTWAPL